MSLPRRPEKHLTVLWQRHLPQGYASGDTLDADDARTDALADLAAEFESVVTDFKDELDRGDLVVTISRRPPLSASVPTPGASEGRSAPEGTREDSPIADPVEDRSEYAVPVEEAMERLVVIPDYDGGNGPGPSVHTFRTGSGMALGAYWSLDVVRAAMEKHGVEEAGDGMSSMGHSLVLIDDAGPVFFEALPKKEVR